MNFEDFTVISPGCGCHRFAVPTTVYILWRRTQQWWYCPHCGGARIYKGESDTEKQLREAKERLNQERNRAARAEGQAGDYVLVPRKLIQQLFLPMPTPGGDMNEYINAATQRQRAVSRARRQLEALAAQQQEGRE